MISHNITVYLIKRQQLLGMRDLFLKHKKNHDYSKLLTNIYIYIYIIYIYIYIYIQSLLNKLCSVKTVTSMCHFLSSKQYCILSRKKVLKDL